MQLSTNWKVPTVSHDQRVQSDAFENARVFRDTEPHATEIFDSAFSFEGYILLDGWKDGQMKSLLQNTNNHSLLQLKSMHAFRCSYPEEL